MTATLPVLTATIEGLPEGLEVVRYGPVRVKEAGVYALSSDSSLTPTGSSTLNVNLLVRAAPGFRIEWDHESSTFTVTRELECPRLFTVPVMTEYQERMLRQFAHANGILMSLRP